MYECGGRGLGVSMFNETAYSVFVRKCLLPCRVVAGSMGCIVYPDYVYHAAFVPLLDDISCLLFLFRKCCFLLLFLFSFFFLSHHAFFFPFFCVWPFRTRLLSPFLTGQIGLFAEHTSDSSTNYDSFLNCTSSSSNMVRTVRRTLLRSQLACNEMQASVRTCGRPHDRKCTLKSRHFNHPSQGNSTNYYLILGPRDKASPPPPTSQQIKTLPPKRGKNLAFLFLFLPPPQESSALSQSEAMFVE